MNLVIDVYDLVKFRGKSIGIYNYTKELLDNLSKEDLNSDQITVLCSEENAHDIIPHNSKFKVIIGGKGTQGKIGKLYWDIIGAYLFFKKSSQNFDVYYNPRGFLPIGLSRLFRKTCITVHDLIPFYYANQTRGFAKIENLYICKRLEKSIRKSTHSITDANATRLEIIKKFNPGKITALHLGVDLTATSNQKKTRDYIFAMASTLPHKNLAGILSSYIRYCEIEKGNSLPLIICGIKSLSETSIDIPPYIASKIQTYKGIDENQLSALYANARVFIFLSHIEGFGYPPFEALRHGTPAIVSDIPVFRELLGQNVTYVKLSDDSETALAISDICSAEAFKVTRISEDFINHFSWKTHINGLIEILNN